MKKITFVALAAILFFSCSIKEAPLKGAYPTPPIITTSDKSFDKVWDNTVDYFAQHGIPIRIIDKASGLIVSDKAKLSWSFEDKNGKLFKKDAFVVLKKMSADYSDKPFKPQEVTGEWNIRVRASGNGTLINVNLYNIEATYEKAYYSYYHGVTYSAVKAEGFTTGVFETTFEDGVK